MFRLDGSCWLTPGEQEEAIGELIEAKLVSWDNARSLPLKSGGKTDIYINLRQMRNRPRVIEYLAGLYENPLRRLRAARFAEVPEAVSLLAGALSVRANIPAVTIREQAKEGRVVSGQLIGDVEAGERIPIIDDVITDGASKVAALMALRSARIDVPALVVLVDRQQGWKKKLAELGFGDVGVWPGMTLHDVRKFLINKGLMVRCEAEKEAKNPIIVALDGKGWEEILPLIDRLRTTGCILKVNDLLFGQGIDRLLPELSVYGRVMADLKGHDIPNTVGNTCRRLRSCPPWAVTVHASGGAEMVRAARTELAGTGTKVLAVTVLTSIEETCHDIYGSPSLEQVLKLADVVGAEADGFVCSAKEVAHLRAKFPDKVLVTPGIRSEGKAVHDQKRVSTPAGAKENGADYLVLGRQLLESADPVAEAERVMTEELGIKL